MIEGLSIEFTAFSIGIMGLLLFAVTSLRNWAAGVMWGVSGLTLLSSLIFAVDVWLWHVTVMSTFLLLIVGMIVRWSV